MADTALTRAERARIRSIITRLLDLLDADEAQHVDLEPEPDEDAEDEASAQPLTLCPDWMAPKPFRPLGEVIDRLVLGVVQGGRHG